jgi:hypothetical protein
MLESCWMTEETLWPGFKRLRRTPLQASGYYDKNQLRAATPP